MSEKDPPAFPRSLPRIEWAPGRPVTEAGIESAMSECGERSRREPA